MAGAPVRLAAQIAQGLHHVFGHRELRALAFTATLTNLGSSSVNTILPVLFIRQLGLKASVYRLRRAARTDRGTPTR
ncbi:hypothetical protein [Streptosporangium roseum]|uniref:hypothetical protein n=1 Tax=Streptosporangium roseum TaxID=2001 RepID=UPI003330BE58